MDTSVQDLEARAAELRVGIATADAEIAAMEVVEEAPVKFPRRVHMREIESKIQKQWADQKVFESEVDTTKEPFFATFPFPYMNGRLHLGHAFTITKADFASGFQRLNGKNVLFPFAFHCTGMPIQAAANKLKSEIEEYGCPPVFPSDEEMQRRKQLADAAGVASKSAEQIAANAAAAKTKGKKTKLVAKKTQWWWDTLLRTGVDVDEIPKFTDPEYWLQYFPPSGVTDLSAFGSPVDWRRSFITTPTNPFYDRFIKWQFRTLRKRGVLDFGKRPTIYSLKDKQACMDHDRSAGEGVGPQEYTLIKIRIKERRGVLASTPALEGKEIYLVAATLRPETMYGQTNCFVLPDGIYGAFATNDPKVVFICSERSAIGMSYQSLSPGWGIVECLCKMEGTDLLGLPLEAPMAKYETVYCLPLLTIKMNKGTGVVTSVPSDSPDDFAALRDLKNKAPLREKYGLTEEMVMPFEVVPIINVPGFGDTAAVVACEKYKVTSQNDKDKLEKAKGEVYLAGFTKGVMLVGSQKGKLVSEAKPLVKQEMLASGDATLYHEPESPVVGRQGDSCIVAQLDQWYIKYGEAEWRARVEAYVSSDEFETYTVLAKQQFMHTLSWLGEWACSRSFGLGTKLPWDQQFVIESLSDSTIYFAYYTIAHHLHGYDNLDGTKTSPSGVKPEQFDDRVFDFLFLEKDMPEGPTPADSAAAIEGDVITAPLPPAELLEKMKAEFKYWYPMNLRVSAKDLIKNHLTMALYNHAAMWEDNDDMLPRSYFTNGMVVVDGQKMSKSTGNFLMLEESCAGDYYDQKTLGDKNPRPLSWCADAVRFALACAGDGLEDANFETQTADIVVQELFIEDKWAQSIVEDTKEGKLRTGGPETYTYMDQVFVNTIKAHTKAAFEGYEKMRFRDVVKFAYYNLHKSRDVYRDSFFRSGEPMHADVLRFYLETQSIIISPIMPHFAEHVYQQHLGHATTDSVLKKDWPKHLHDEIDAALLHTSEYLFSVRSNFLAQLAKADTKSKMKKKGGKAKAPAPPAAEAVAAVADAGPKKAVVFVTKSLPEWKKALLTFLRKRYDDFGGSFPSGVEGKLFMKELSDFGKTEPSYKAEPKAAKQAMKVASWTMAQVAEVGESALALSVPFDEEVILRDNLAYMEASLHVEITIVDLDKGPEGSEHYEIGNDGSVEPGKPKMYTLN